MTSAYTQQETFQFRNDDGSLTTATYMGTQDSNQTIAGDTVFRLRILVREINSKNDPWAFQAYAQKNGSGGYTAVTTTRSDGLQYADDANSIADGTAITVQDLTWSTGTWVDGEYDDAQSAAGTGTIGLSGQYTEIEFCLKIDSANASNGDYWDIQLYSTGGTSLDNYNATPRVTASITASVNVTLSAASLAANGQAVTLAPGAVTKSLNAASLVASGQALTLYTITTILLSYASLASVGQTASIVPGAMTKVLNVASLVASGQTITVNAGGASPITVVLSNATLTASGQAFTLSPGAISLPLNNATITAIGQALTLAPGSVSVSLDAAIAIANGQALAPAPGEATVSLSAANLTASGQPVSIISNIIVALAAGVIGVSGRKITIPGSEAVGKAARKLFIAVRRLGMRL